MNYSAPHQAIIHKVAICPKKWPEGRGGFAVTRLLQGRLPTRKRVQRTEPLATAWLI